MIKAYGIIHKSIYFLKIWQWFINKLFILHLQFDYVADVISRHVICECYIKVYWVLFDCATNNALRSTDINVSCFWYQCRDQCHEQLLNIIFVFYHFFICLIAGLGAFLANMAHANPAIFVSFVGFGVVALLALVCNELIVSAREAQGEEGKWYIQVYCSYFVLFCACKNVWSTMKRELFFANIIFSTRELFLPT